MHLPTFTTENDGIASGDKIISFGQAGASIRVPEFAAVGPADWAVVAVYVAAMIAVLVYVSRTVGTKDSEHFFLGGRNMPWWAIGMSLFASNLGTDHLVGLAGSGAAGGLAVGQYEWSGAMILLVLGWVFVPKYLAMSISTVPEYLERRHGPGLRAFFMALTILTSFFTKITVTIYAGSVVLQEVLGWNMWTSSVVLLTLTSLYTAIGGLAAVVYTEVLQSVIMVLGSFALLYFSLDAVGGWNGLHQNLPESHFEVVKPLSHPDFPWLGVLIGLPINSIWYWCTDQVMVQRVLATGVVADAQKGCLLGGWLKILPMYIMVLPGMVAAALFPEEVAINSNRAYPLLVKSVMPTGLVGVMIAVMLSSFTASLASCFNSCSTLFTLDLYKKLVPQSSEEDLVRVGRIFTVAIVAASFAWLPVIMRSNDQLFLYIQSMQVIWCSPIVVVFIASLFSDTFSATNAWVILCAGLSLGTLFWFVRELFEESQLPAMLGPVHNLNILHFSIVSFIFCSVLGAITHSLEARVRDVGSLDERIQLREHIKTTGTSSSDVERLKFADWGTSGAAVCLVASVVGLTVFHSMI